MPFRSPLLSVLRLRTSLERVAWLKLRATLVSIASAQARVEELLQKRLLFRRSSIKRLRQGAASHDLRLDSVSALDLEEDQLKQRIRQLQRERRLAEAGFLEARRRREIVENAIKSQKAAYEAEWSRRLQIITDDETLQRRTRQGNDDH